MNDKYKLEISNMKKYMIIVLTLISMSVSAQSSHSIGRISTFIGTTVSLSILDSNGRKTAFMYTRGRYGIRKASAGMNKAEAIRLRDLLNEAIKEL